MHPQSPTTATRPILAPNVARSTQAAASTPTPISAQATDEKSDTVRVEIKESTYKAIATRVVEYAYEKEVSHLDCEEFSNGDRMIFIDGTIYANQEHEVDEEVGYSGINIILLRYDLQCTAFDLEGDNYAATDFDQTRLEKYL